MFQLDEKFLEDLGLESLPEDQRKAFLQHIYEELELRVGTKLSDGLSDAQMEEFAAIVDKKKDVTDPWVQKHMPNYKQEAQFQSLQQLTKRDADDMGLRDEYIATKWLEINRPDYKQVVNDTINEIKKEIKDNRDAILGVD